MGVAACMEGISKGPTDSQLSGLGWRCQSHLFRGRQWQMAILSTVTQYCTNRRNKVRCMVDFAGIGCVSHIMDELAKLNIQMNWRPHRLTMLDNLLRLLV